MQKKHKDYTKFCNYALEGKGGRRKKPKDPNRLATAVEYLEWKFPLPGDDPWYHTHTGYDTAGNVIDEKRLHPATHHLDDLSHHPTLVGLIACIYSQFTQTGTYVNVENQVIKIPFEVDENGLLDGKTPVAKAGLGVIEWCFGVAQNRHGHLMSDIGGTKSKAGRRKHEQQTQCPSEGTEEREDP